MFDRVHHLHHLWTFGTLVCLIEKFNNPPLLVLTILIKAVYFFVEEPDAIIIMVFLPTNSANKAAKDFL